MDIGNALTRYLSERAHKLDSYAHQELHRFASHIGREKLIEQVRAPHVAGYAETEVSKGGDVKGRLDPVKGFLTYLSKKGLHTENLSTHVKIPRPSTRGGAVSSQTESQAVEMTQSGLEARKNELAELKGRRPEIVQAIRTAAADKDFRENAPLDAAREEQGKLEARIRTLEEEIRRARVVDHVDGVGVDATDTSNGTDAPAADRRSVARVGAKVSLCDMETGRDVTYTIVDTIEADPAASKISVSSPVGAAVAGKAEGDEVSVQTPKGPRRYLVNKVEFQVAR